MPKRDIVRKIDLKPSGTGSVLVGGGGSGGGGGVSDHGALTGLGDDDHPHYLNTTRANLLYVPLARQVTAGAGLTGGGALTDDRTFAVGAGTLISVAADSVGIAAGSAYQFIGTGGDTTPEWRNVSGLAGAGLTHATGVLAVGAGAGITVNADSVALTTPGDLAWNSDSSATGNHTHAIASSANVAGGVTALLRSNAGNLALDELSAAVRVGASLINTYSGDTTISPAAHLILQPQGDLYIDPLNNNARLQSGVLVRTENYASQTAGWRATYGGEADFRYLFTDELHAKAFIADLEQALAGGQIIGKSVVVLAQDFTAPDAATGAFLYVYSLPGADGMDVFQADDVVGVRQFSRSGGALNITGAFGTVRKNAGEPVYSTDADGNEVQRWHWTRLSPIGGGTAGGGMAAGNVVQAKSLALDYGVSGNGFYEVNAIDGLYGLNSPYAQIVTWTGSPNTNRVVRTRMGNLRGVTGNTGEYGLYAGAGTADADAHVIVSSTQAKLNKVPLTMFNGATKTGEWLSDGSLRLGKDGVGTANDRDFYVDTVNGVARLGRQASGKANLWWDGTDLHLRQNATPVITLASNGNSYFAGVMTIGTGGEIRQGTVSSGNVWESLTGFTGLRLWRDESVGRIAGYNGGTVQWHAGTDGKLYAGAGNVRLDATGIVLDIDSAIPYLRVVDPTDPNPTRVRWLNYEDTAHWQVMGTTTPVASIAMSGSQVTISTNGDIDLSGDIVQINSDAQIYGTLALNGDNTGDPIVSVIGEATGLLAGSTNVGLMLDFAAVLESHLDNADSSLRLGIGNTYSKNANIDFHTYGSDPSTQNARIIRNSGQNGALWVTNYGTGGIAINNVGAGSLGLATNNTTRLFITSDGDIGIGNTGPSSKLHVSGVITAQYLIATVSKTPTGSTDSSGTQGEIRWDGSYLYVRVANSGNYWKRVSLSNF